MIKIRSKSSLDPHKHFTEHLVGVFKKSPRKNDMNHESSSLLIRWLKNITGTRSCNNPHTRTWIDASKNTCEIDDKNQIKEQFISSHVFYRTPGRRAQKSPWKNDLNHESSSLLIWWLKNITGMRSCNNSHTRTWSKIKTLRSRNSCSRGDRTSGATETQVLQEQKQSRTTGPAGNLNQKRNPAGGLSSTKQKKRGSNSWFCSWI
jgi:hypothetical protein